MKKKLFVGVIVVFLLIGGFVAQAMVSAGAFKTIEPHFGGQCTVVEGVTGAEDITVDPVTGIAYISAMDRRKLAASGEHDGGIYLYFPGTFEAPAMMLTTYEGDFHPHGISLWKAPENSGQNDRLFVVNHPPIMDDDGAVTGQSSQVDIFEISGLILSHVASVTPRDPISLNDVAAFGPETFFASIDQGSTTSLGRTLEVYGRLARSGILLGHKGETEKILGDMVYANGVQLSKDKSILYVAETTGKRLSSYAVNPNTGRLTLKGEREIDSGLDNIEIDADGTLWVVSHPKTFDFLAHAGDPANRSASQIFSVSDDGESLAETEIYLSDGNPMSGASVAAPVGNRFIMGSVFEPFILDCTL